MEPDRLSNPSPIKAKDVALVTSTLLVVNEDKEEKINHPAGPASGHPNDTDENVAVTVEAVQIKVKKAKVQAVRKASHSSNSSDEPPHHQNKDG
jgi:hypothetical protein